MLVDRSTARITTGQRISLNSVEEAAVETPLQLAVLAMQAQCMQSSSSPQWSGRAVARPEQHAVCRVVPHTAAETAPAAAAAWKLKGLLSVL